MEKQTGKQLRYLERISKSAEEQSKEGLPFVNEEAEMKIDSDILETRKVISQIKGAIENLKSAVPFNPGAIVAKGAELNGYESGLVCLQALKKELFG